jgi:pyruvoyl-dependent arginine decarboxylase (PvlArgDC)
MIDEYGDKSRAMNAPAPANSTLLAIIERAANSPEFDLDRLEKLLVLKERWDANEARNAYIAAMAAFKANPPKILKNKHVAYRNKAGGLTEYDHATHSEVVEKIAAGLAAHGLSHSWGINQTVDGIEVTCAVTHVRGHFERATLRAVADESGGKNSIQAIGSAITYLQRYTLLSATGLTSADIEDNDGRGMPEIPEAPADAWISLKDAAELGTDALKVAWRALSEDTRNIISTHHAAQWTQLKELGAKKAEPANA